MKEFQSTTSNTNGLLSSRAQRSSERGIQLVEVTFVMPLLLLLLAATAEFGRYFYTYSVLARATRVSARYLSGSLLNNTELTKAKNLALCGQLTAACTSGVISPGMAIANVQVTTAGGTTILPATVTVSIVNYNYQSVFDLGRWTGGSWANIPVAPSTTMRYQLEN